MEGVGSVKCKPTTTSNRVIVVWFQLHASFVNVGKMSRWQRRLSHIDPWPLTPLPTLSPTRGWRVPSLKVSGLPVRVEGCRCRANAPRLGDHGPAICFIQRSREPPSLPHHAYCPSIWPQDSRHKGFTCTVFDFVSCLLLIHLIMKKCFKLTVFAVNNNV